MRHILWVWAIPAALWGAGCGGGTAGDCDTNADCPDGFRCYAGICLPGVEDVGTAEGDTTPDDARDAETGDYPESGREDTGGGCRSADDCNDGNPCTADLCDTITGACVDQPSLAGTPCADDGDPCTLDVCDGTPVCSHPADPACCTEDWQCEDGNPCTADYCTDGRCSSAVTPDCCSRDADCLWPGHLWECDPASGTCYDPPAGEVCAECGTRRDCGDGGEGSDDFCVYYDTSWGSQPGCSKDCAEDVDCPQGFICWSREADRPCIGEVGCYCLFRTGSCGLYQTFGQECRTGMECTMRCGDCGGMQCLEGYCSYPCEGDPDCPAGAFCAEGFCRR